MNDHEAFRAACAGAPRIPDSRCSGRPEFDGVRREAVAMVGSLGWTAKDHRQ